MYLKPTDGLSIPDPARGDLLPASGREVPETQYWLRRLADGDVQKAKPPTIKKGDQE